MTEKKKERESKSRQNVWIERHKEDKDPAIQREGLKQDSSLLHSPAEPS